MATLRKEARGVLDEALAIGVQIEKERTRHRNANEKTMVRAASNVYAAHLMELIDPQGYSPPHPGAQGREEAKAAATEGMVLTAKAYAMVLGYSEAYISRLFRLGFGMAAGVLNPDEVSSNGPTRWQLLSRTLGDTPEIGAVLGKDVNVLPTEEAVEEAIAKAKERKQKERAVAAAQRAEMPEGPIPQRPSEQIDLLEDLMGTLAEGRHLTQRQIERVRHVMDEMRGFIETWMREEDAAGQRKAS
jgi:hypothetical protein